MLTLRYNPATERYDCYKDEHIVYTLTCAQGLIYIVMMRVHW